MGSDVQNLKEGGDDYVISIHAPRMGSDRFREFLESMKHISIHAPRMGSDDSEKYDILKARNFNPRSPHGERPLEDYFGLPTGVFQSTLPAWGATTLNHFLTLIMGYFNPRSPHGERLSFLIVFFGSTGFQSTLPAWGATM